MLTMTYHREFIDWRKDMNREFQDSVIQWSPLLAAGGVAILLTLLRSYQRTGRRARARRLIARPRLSAADWFGRHYPVDIAQRELIQQLLMVFSREIDVDWTQLLPKDDFGRELCVEPRYSDGEDCDGIALDLKSIAKAQHWELSRIPKLEGTLRRVLDQFVQLNGGSPPLC